MPHWVFPGGSLVKNLPANTGDPCSIPGSGRPPGEGNGNSLQYSCLQNPMERSLAGYSPWGCKELDTTESLRVLSEHIFTHTSTHFCQLCPVFTFSFHILAHLPDKILLTVPSNPIHQFIHSMLLQLPTIYSSTQSFI